jgi:hypothetical protein
MAGMSDQGAVLLLTSVSSCFAAFSVCSQVLTSPRGSSRKRCNSTQSCLPVPGCKLHLFAVQRVRKVSAPNSSPFLPRSSPHRIYHAYTLPSTLGAPARSSLPQPCADLATLVADSWPRTSSGCWPLTIWHALSVPVLRSRLSGRLLSSPLPLPIPVPAWASSPPTPTLAQGSRLRQQNE